MTAQKTPWASLTAQRAESLLVVSYAVAKATAMEVGPDHQANAFADALVRAYALRVYRALGLPLPDVFGGGK